MKSRAMIGIASASLLALGALLAGAGIAQAAPPPGWTGDDGGVEYDLADVTWTHHGRYPGELGNWHTGYLNVEEDDDGVTGWLIDWRCPDGVQPPSATDADQTSVCKQKGNLWLENFQDWDSAKLDFARNRMDLDIDVDAYDGIVGDYVRSVRIDIVLKGLGKSTVTSDQSGEILDWSEIWYDVKAWGHVDGHRIAGPNTETQTYRMGYWLDGWTRST
ncbi:MAG TPA: hypothetical protein VLK34_05885 [Nocardioidaceae bacterium]|nr:hypothetical protein [Nocardioidaceae bacterium]